MAKPFGCCVISSDVQTYDLLLIDLVEENYDISFCLDTVLNDIIMPPSKITDLVLHKN